MQSNQQHVVCDMVFVYEPSTGNDYRLFDQYREAGIDFIQCHPAGDDHNISQAIALIGAFRRDVLSQPDQCVLIESVDDIHRAKRAGKLAVGLQMEGFRCLERNLDMVEVFHKLGLRLCHPIFNIPNSLGGGCFEGQEQGLTRFGKAVIAEMNRVGIIVDGAHAGLRSQLDMFDISSSPVVLSHHASAALHPHPRNVSDDLARRCAAHNGVVGITSAGYYLGGKPVAQLYFRHVDHFVQQIGADHVGFALDFCIDTNALRTFFAANAAVWPGKAEDLWEPVEFGPPSIIRETQQLMLDAGYPQDAVHQIAGGNWLRVCAESWR